MKSTGVVRKVDELGRIVLPISIRQTMDINEKDSLEIFTDENKITPYEADDTFSFLVKSPGEEISFLKKNK